MRLHFTSFILLYRTMCVYVSHILFSLCSSPPPPPLSLPLSFMHKDEDSCFILLSWMCCSLLVKFRTDYLRIKFQSEKELNGAIFQNIKPNIFT